MLFTCSTLGATGAENLKAANESGNAAGPRAVAHTEQAIAVVFTVRIIHNGQKALARAADSHAAAVGPPAPGHRPFGNRRPAAREFDRWKEPVIVYRQPELSPGGVLTGRWTAECRIRELQWNLNGPTGRLRRALSAEERALYLAMPKTSP